MAYGLGQGLVVGLLIGAFFLFWRTRLAGKDPASDSTKASIVVSGPPRINWIRIASFAIGIPVSLYCLLAIFVYFQLGKTVIRAEPKNEGLSIRYYGFKPVMIVGFDNSSGPGGIYTIRRPRVYDFKTFGDIVPWNSLEPADPEDGKATFDSGERWRVLYIELREGERPQDVQRSR